MGVVALSALDTLLDVPVPVQAAIVTSHSIDTEAVHQYVVFITGETPRELCVRIGSGIFRCAVGVETNAQ